MMNYLMEKTYTLVDLAMPETYEQDEILARLCRQEIMLKLPLSKGEAKKALLAGQYPEVVKEHIEPLYKEYQRLLKLFDETKNKLCGKYQLIEIERGQDDYYALFTAGDFDADLNTRIKRMGGFWDGKTGDNRRLWLIPLNKIKSLPRVVMNHISAIDKKTWEEIEAKAKKEEADKKRLNERLKQRAQQQAEYEKEMDKRRQAQARAIAERVKVEVGKYQVGDEINGRSIVNFGSSWTEKSGAPDHLMRTQLWEPCSCGREPVYLEADHRCEHCISKEYGEETAFCYAYFS